MNHPALRVDRFVNAAFGSNTYRLTCPGSLNCVLIDPGEEAVLQMAENLETPGRRVEYALLTHEHYDHISGVLAIQSRGNSQVICSNQCSTAITNPTLNFSRYLIQRDVACAAADRSCEELDWKLTWNGLEFRFIPTPGHSPGSICIAVENVLFSGDSLLHNLKRVTNLPGGDKKAWEKSVALLLDTFDPEALVHPGHGEPFQLKDVARAFAAGSRCTG